jgi:NAD-dependent aldehyde dehydrogenases
MRARSPITGEDLLDVPAATSADVENAIAAAKDAFTTWRTVPAPIRGALIKRLGALLHDHMAEIAELITIEAGKIPSEALGEVQEMIDICDFAVGLSRQLDGRTMPSERPSHRLMETWHPLGVVAVISAFNFPAAVWSWNTAIALVCGDSVVWKPSPMTPSESASTAPTSGLGLTKPRPCSAISIARARWRRSMSVGAVIAPADVIAGLRNLRRAAAQPVPASDPGAAHLPSVSR